jgi:sulfite reductase alpha subunit-like flavoprotein
MRDEVRDAFVEIVSEHGAMPRERGESFLEELETESRYRPDVWG